MEWSGASWGGAEGLLSGCGPSAEMVSGQRPEGWAQGRRAWWSSRAVWQGGVSLVWNSPGAAGSGASVGRDLSETGLMMVCLEPCPTPS